MPQLAAVYSPHLHSLLDQKFALDAIEFTPWQSPSLLSRILPELSGYTIYYHGSNLADRLSLLPGARSQLAETLRLTRAKWFSTHLSLLPLGWVWLSLCFDVHLPPPPIKWLLPRFMRRVQRLKAEHPQIPLLLENMPVEPRRIYKHFKHPNLIREVIERTDCGFLLDLPHARIAAEAFGMETTEYLQCLPLERVMEIHTSGPTRRHDGILFDQHTVMQAEDYRLLEWALEHTPVQLVTLEYFKDREGLENQLLDLSQMIKQKDRRADHAADS